MYLLNELDKKLLSNKVLMSLYDIVMVHQLDVKFTKKLIYFTIWKRH